MMQVDTSMAMAGTGPTGQRQRGRLLICLALIAGAWLLAAYRPSRPMARHFLADPTLLDSNGVHGLEYDQTTGQPFRWTAGNSQIALAARPNSAILSLPMYVRPELSAGFSTHVTLDNRHELTLPGWPGTTRITHIFVDQQSASDTILRLAFHSPTALINGRELAFALGDSSLQETAFPAAGKLCLLALITTICWLGYLIAGRLRGSRLGAALWLFIAVALGGIEWTLADQRWIMLRWLGAVAAGLAAIAWPTRMGHGHRLGRGILVLAGSAVVVAFWPQLTTPLWIDEQWRAYHASFGPNWWAEVRSSPDGPMALGWLLIERLFTLLFGNSEVALRAPVILALIGLDLAVFEFARRWLRYNVLAAVWIPLLLTSTTAYINFSTQLKPYVFEAMWTVIALWLWFRYEDGASTPQQRWLLSLGILWCCLCSIPTVFVLAPMGLISLKQGWPRRRAAVRAAALRLLPLAVAALLAGAHLLFFLLPQSQLAQSAFWEDHFMPHTAAVLPRFFSDQLRSYVPGLLLGAIEGGARGLQYTIPAYSPAAVNATTMLMSAGLALSAVAAFFSRSLRRLWFIAATVLGLQLLASYQRLWPFGYTRINMFLGPLLWMLVSSGYISLIRRAQDWLHGRGPGFRAGRYALSALSLLMLLGVTGWTAQRQARYIYLNQAHVRYGDGMRELVAAARSVCRPDDPILIVHQQAWKGWQYYMWFYEGDNGAARLPRCGARRFAHAPDFSAANVPALLDPAAAGHPIWIMGLQGLSGFIPEDQLQLLERQHYAVRPIPIVHSIESTGVIWAVKEQRDR